MTVALKLTDMETALIDQLPQDAPLRAVLSEHGLPHRRVEEWKWTDLRTVVGKLPAEPGVLTFTISREPDAWAEQDEEPSLLMPRLASALGEDIQVYTLEDGERLELGIEASSGVSNQQVLVLVPEGVKAELVESYAVEPDGFANLTLVIVVMPGAELDRVIEQHASPDAALVVTSLIDLAPGAKLNQTTLGFGAKLARLETHVSHAGEGAELQLDGAYVLDEGLHLDQTSLVRHEGPNGVTKELFKGAAARGAKGVFQGKIHVEQAAQKTDAQMQHRGLLLDDKAEIDAKPELEIYADDVVCAHGNAFGALDEDALFYMRQRGLPESKARALLTQSFLAEPIERIRDEDDRERLLARLMVGLEAL
ncbi:MAG: Fe-S cluster assembly protein SufD [Oceanicaulis sp.]|uniref:Fe-S cluster assembly protein SufD n=1 Tax=unclassified Oceanicaulis TaxID=2632123 RepID=UPI000C482FDB|nr:MULTISPECIES: Fe-S cluster assembly protein SufD [unclassified Oceanicaulis]MAB70595.1 Fe-S cluster assembly protein SufD [Oceanicaulis sp.]MBC39227.1 Fe-S cluster assembly protein SufD [Oceanicaulis sp.]MBG37230.1 Fe-S cluster assembly protein SufD [Oceanicaulis sp.]HBU61313.1 Fe-S cluster assembly protein SufD [Oceanicaulis sp.]|tara:strand:- start:141 stop:1238 length:1098 start_codon:yes stop_codon:yes gene_type:complete